MPRHPPCALNNEHTNHPHQKAQVATQVNLTKKLTKEKRNHTNTHKQTTQSSPSSVCLMLASTIQFSHNTPTTPHQHTQCQQDSWSGTQKRGNNAPDTQQCTNIQTTYFSQLCTARVSQSAIQTLGFYLLRCVFHPDNFQINKKGRQHDTRILNQPGCNCTRKIKAP